MDDNNSDEIKVNITEGPMGDDASETIDIASETTSENPSASSGQTAASVSLSLENLIRGHISTIERLKKEISEHTDTLNNVLANDPTYKAHDEEAKKAAKQKTATKGEIMKRPDVMQVNSKIKAAREEIKEQGQTLSELLAEYARSTGLDSIELENGKVKKIVMTAKLVS
jgi:predicted RNase H-like nuclease (RuvC/YqgF family)